MITSGISPAPSTWGVQSAEKSGSIVVVGGEREVERRVHRTATTLFKNVVGAFLLVGAVATIAAIPITLQVMAMISGLAMVPILMEAIAGGSIDGERKIGRYILGAAAATGGSGILAHELGHAMAARATIAGASPRINIRPFYGGSTTFSTAGSLTPFGALLGLRGSLTLITAAGMIGTLLCASIAFLVARRIEDGASATADFLNGHAVAQLFNELIYAFSAFSTNSGDLGHDYIRLWKSSGIHPAFPIAALLLVPAIHLIAGKRLWRSEG